MFYEVVTLYKVCPTLPAVASCAPADPLRVLRAVRFGTRFGFRLHEDILAAASSDPVRAVLHCGSTQAQGRDLLLLPRMGAALGP